MSFLSNLSVCSKKHHTRNDGSHYIKQNQAHFNLCTQMQSNIFLWSDVINHIEQLEAFQYVKRLCKRCSAPSGGIGWWLVDWPFSKVRKLFVRGCSLQQIPWISAERAIWAKVQALKFEISKKTSIIFKAHSAQRPVLQSSRPQHVHNPKWLLTDTNVVKIQEWLWTFWICSICLERFTKVLLKLWRLHKIYTIPLGTLRLHFIILFSGHHCS